LNEEKLLKILQADKPYLYLLEKEIEKVANATGYGDVSVSCIVRGGKVFSTDIIHAKKYLHKKK